MLIAVYPSKKALREAKGQPLKHLETSMFGQEYKDNGTLTVANRPHVTGIGREFFATVEMVDGKISSVD